MRKVIAALLVLAGIAAGLYVGGYLMFIGGITQIVDAVQEEPIEGSEIAWGIVRIVFASLVGVVTFLVPTFVGALIGEGPITNRGIHKQRQRIRNRRGIV